MRAIKTRASSHRLADVVELAAAMLGQLHAYVCDNITPGVTAYELRFLTGLPKRTVDVTVAGLLSCGLIARHGLALQHGQIPENVVKAFAGQKHAAKFLVHAELARRTPRSETYRRRRTQGH